MGSPPVGAPMAAPVMAAPPPTPVPGMAGMPVAPTAPPVPEMGAGRDPVVEMPGINMAASFFPAEKKVMLSPTDHSSTTEKIDKYIKLIQSNFRVDGLTNEEGNIQISFDPREDFESVIQFLNQLGIEA